VSKILIVDDDEGVRGYLSRLLSHLGYEVQQAESGQQGLDLLGQTEVDAVLTDLKLPAEPSGLNLVRAIREARPTCPVVVISGYPSEDLLAECQTLGVKEFLTKPFELSFVKQVLTRILNDETAEGEKVDPAE
jgi:DNA-binding NtrC family response regulator